LKGGRRWIAVKFKYHIILPLFLFADTSLAAINCSNPKEVCVDPGGDTRYFDGAPYSLPCWKYEITYECTADSDNNCKQLIADGCSPSTTNCLLKWGNDCAVKEMTYDCPTRFCDGTKMVCNDQNSFCAMGNCASHERSKDNDMSKSLAALSAAAEVAHHLDTIDPNNPKIFGGKPRECSKNFLSGITKDCCGINASGFLEGKILTCEPEELEIARAKEAGRAVELGEYCHNKVLGVCTSWHTTHCLFQSKLARIIQVAAEKQYVRESFGDPQNPNCRPLDADEFQWINFSKVDFDDFYKDIEGKMKQESSDSVVDKAKKATEEYKQRAAEFNGNAEKMRDKMQTKMKGVQDNTVKKTEESVVDRDKEKAKGW
jgi:conjugal transfer mating pair stabilization protein TraN